MNIVILKKMTKVKLLAGICIFILLIAVIVHFNISLNNVVPSVLEYKSIKSGEEANEVTFEELSYIKEQCKEEQITAYSEKTSNISTEFQNYEASVKLVVTDENYFNIYPIKLESGLCFNESQINSGENIAIISDTLALKLFKNTNAAGKTIYISGKGYSVLGVYKKEKGFIYSLCDDSYEKVYIPYSSYGKMGKNTINVISASENSKVNESKLSYNIKAIVGEKIESYRIKDYSIEKNIVFQNINILYFIIGIVTVVLIIKRIIKYIEAMTAAIKSRLKNKYIKQVIKDARHILLSFALKIIIYVLIALLLFKTMQFTLRIPDQYMPDNNLFDFSFYREKIILQAQLQNSGLNGIVRTADRYLSVVWNIEAVCTFFSLIVFIAIGLGIKELDFMDMRLSKGVRYCYFSFCGTVILFIISYIIRMNILDYLKYYLMFQLYIFICFINMKSTVNS